MKLVMTLLVRDEETILRENLWFHLEQGVDFFVVTDNGSEDSSREILEEYRRQGLLEIIEEPGRDYSQYRWVTRMARRAFSEHRADWVINNDADEFWWPEQGTIRMVLDQVPAEYGFLKVPRYNFLPTANEDSWFVDRLVLRQAISTNALGKPLPGKICHRGAADIELRQGNHSGLSKSLGGVLDAPLAAILHYPYRMLAQARRSANHSGRGYELNDTLPDSVGRVKRHLFSLIHEGGFDEFYRSLIPDPAAIDSLLASGELVLDRRLQGFFRDRGFPPPAGPAENPDETGIAP